MKQLTLVAAALFFATSATPSFAELVQSQPLTHFDTPNLSSELLERDNTALNSSLFNTDSALNSADNSTTTQRTKTAINPTPSVTERSKTSARPATLATSAINRDNRDDSRDNNEDDGIISRMTTLTKQTVRSMTQSGAASYYGRQFHGRKTASGERFDMNAMTAAHRTLPLSCYIRVTNQSTGKSVVVKVNDRGPFHGKRILDLSYAAAQQLGITQAGTGNVTIERISTPN